MKLIEKFGMAALALSVTALTALPAQAKFETGSKLPDLQVVDSNGITHDLSSFDGKRVVLEWTNYDCPFVKKHYDSRLKNMQNLQASAAEDDVIWLSIISSAEGKQGYMVGEDLDARTAALGAAPAAIVIDTAGDAGKAFSAKTTPHMFVIDENRTLVYQGAIDSKRSANPADIPGATNYVTAALDSLEAGEAVETSETKPYGCSVKYGKSSYGS